MCGFVWTFLTNFEEKQEITEVGSAILFELHQHLSTGDFTHGQMAVAHGEERFVCDRFLQGELTSDKFPWITSKKKQKYYLWQFPRWVLWINQKQLKRLNQSQLVKWMTCCLCDVFVLAPNLKLKLNSVVRSREEIKKWWELAGMLTWYCELQMSSHITIEIEFQAGVYGRVCEYM